MPQKTVKVSSFPDEKEFNDCPKKFELLEDEEGDMVFGRCVASKFGKLVQIAKVDTTKNYGLEKGEEPQFLLDITNCNVEKLAPTSSDTKEVLRGTGINMTQYKELGLISKANEHVSYGLCTNYPLGKKRSDGKTDEALLFKTQKSAIDYMNKELVKPKYTTPAFLR